MSDPYANLSPSGWEAPSSAVYLVVPNDDAALPRVARQLRIWNPGATVQTVTFKTYDGGQITLNFPPQSLTFEDVLVTKVFETGTGASLIIHAYSN